MQDIIQHLKIHDYTNPVDFINKDDLAAFIKEAKKAPTSLKCLHKKSEFIRSIAQSPFIISVVKEIIGDKFYLWGSSLVTSTANHVHRYHVDAEHFHIKGVTVSIALENCSDKNKFYFMSNSDSIPISPQELNEKSKDVLEKHANNYNVNAKNIELTMTDGQCMFWKGRTWHSTENHSTETRLSFILQYAISIPNIPKSYDNSRMPTSDKRFDAMYIDTADIK